jgi:hypothetical protein
LVVPMAALLADPLADRPEALLEGLAVLEEE